MLLAEGAGLEPARDFSHWFSGPAEYHYRNPPKATHILTILLPKSQNGN